MYCSTCGFQLPNGAACCPRCGAPVQKQQWAPPQPKKRRLGFWKTVCLIVVCCIVIPCFFKGGSRDKTREPDARLSAARLVEDYKSNEAAAEKRWRGRTIAVDGTVDRIGISFGDPYVVLSEGGSLSGVRCDMDKSRMDEAARIQKGQTVAVIGDVGSYIVGEVFLRRCRILDADPASAPSKPEDRIEALSLPELQADASSLVRDYEASGGALMRRRASVSGTVDHVDVVSGDLYVHLEGGVRCLMDGVVRFAKGQQVILAGTISAYRPGIVELRECRVHGEGPVPEGRTAGDAHAVASAQDSRPAASPCAKTASWDAWFSAPMDFRTAHPECRPDPDTLQAPSISADRLAIEYRDNEVAAEENYKGRMLVVTGEVRSVETDMDGSPRIWLETKTGRGVLCGLALSERRKATSLRKGQTVSLVGLVGVSIMRTPTLDEAVLLEGEPASYSNTARYLRLKKRDCAEVLTTAQVEDGAAAEITCSRRGGGRARYLLVLRECRLGTRGDVKDLKK